MEQSLSSLSSLVSLLSRLPSPVYSLSLSRLSLSRALSLSPLSSLLSPASQRRSHPSIRLRAGCLNCLTRAGEVMRQGPVLLRARQGRASKVAPTPEVHWCTSRRTAPLLFGPLEKLSLRRSALQGT